jgi:hypothetical protein
MSTAISAKLAFLRDGMIERVPTRNFSVIVKTSFSRRRAMTDSLCDDPLTFHS